MSMEHFLMLLQDLITMAKTHDEQDYAFQVLLNLEKLIDSSQMVDGDLYYAVHVAADSFDFFCDNRDKFAGKPGHYTTNKNKRQRMAAYLKPSC